MAIITSFLQYFFDPLPAGPFRYMNIFLIFTGCLLGCSILLRVLLKKRKEDKVFRKYFRSLPGTLQTIAILEGIYILSRYENIPYLSMRFLNYILMATTLYFFVKNLQIYLKDYPNAQKHRAHQLELNAYLPRKKNR